MSGFLTNGVPNVPSIAGAEQLPIDTQNAQGINPESGSISMIQLAAWVKFLGASISHATVAGTRYYSSFNLGVTQQLTGIEVLIGATGGTDKFIVELHNSAGTLVATSATAGVTAGAANTVQHIPFTAAYNAPAGTYFLTLQSNGTTATFQAYANDVAPSGMVNGSAAGTFGTGAAITPPTTYTQSLGPVLAPYV